MATLIQPESSPPKSRAPLELPGTFSSSQAEDTFTLGKRLAPLLEKGSIVALNGPLGAGKTCFIKGVAVGLGVEEEVTSPTYTIVSEYEGSLLGKTIPVYHIDAYRLRGTDDFSAIGGEEMIFGDGISLVEWSENINDFIPPEALRVDIEISANGDNKRLLRIYRGEKGADMEDCK